MGTLRPGNVVEVKSAEGEVTTYQAKNVIIATGSVPVELPFLRFDEERILSNVGALALPQVPEHLVVVGGGVIGLELGSVWRRLGAKVTGARREGDRIQVDVEKDGQKETLDATHVLVCVGRRPSLAGIDAAALGLALGERGEIKVDAQMRTNLPNVFAIGDAVGGQLLAHKAEEEGVVAAEVIAGKPAHMDYRAVPAIVYTWPEIATVGLTEQQVKQSGREYRVGRFPYSANGRARTAGETTGFVKFIADAKTDTLLGAHMIGPTVSELVSEVVLAFEYGASSEDIGITIHGHPTLSEATKEAALSVLGRPIHI
jgi:dihydrolipoamide dehydrogenase